MMVHGLTAGRRVVPPPAGFDRDAPRGIYAVVRPMLGRVWDSRHRIEDTRDGHGRVV